MRTLAFDGRMGASGDMVLGALLAAGADRDALAPVEDALDVEYRVRRVEKCGVAATKVDVVLSGDGGDDSDDTAPGDNHDHAGDDHSHEHDHAEGRGPTRTLPEVREVVAGMDLPDDVAADARAVFDLLAEAEAAVHGSDPEATTFHEVGADDAIADVVGAALLLDDLGVERVVTAPVATGGGEVDTAHGTYPVPPPAVVELAERADWELRGGPVERELLTPTGAAVLAHYADGVETLPATTVSASGYGAGGYDVPDRPNVLRALVGEARGGLVREGVALLETTLDDAAPEVLGGLQDTLREVGALDVSVLPLTGKKSRPGHLVKVVADPADAGRVARRLAVETGTLGVRESRVDHRWVADRRIEAVTVTVDGDEHGVDVKVATDDAGEVVDVSAEYDDAAAVAAGTDLPIREVMRRAEAAFRDGE